MSIVRIIDPPGNPDFVRFSSDAPRRFLLTVDTEEEFDWSRPLQRSGHTVQSVPSIARFQQFCEEHGVVPVYLIDWPIAECPQAAEVLRDPVAAGRAEVGVQLHPWVNPPFEEEVTPINSYAGNLPEPLERGKFGQLRDLIAKNFGAAPLTYRAGRYGVGPNSLPILTDHGMRIDSSVRARFDYSASGGPNFRDHPVRPYWLDRAAGLIEIPLTTVFWGPLRQQAHWLYPRMWRIPRLRGALARLGLMERIPLTPEGVTVEEALRGIDIAIDEDLPILNFSFHSPSLAPGYTPYVRDADDLEAFYDWWRRIFAYLELRGVKPAAPSAILDSIALA